MAKSWISGAIKHPGALTRQAKASGESPMAFAREHKGDPGTTGKRARLALTLQGFHGGKKGGEESARHERGESRAVERSENLTPASRPLLKASR